MGLEREIVEVVVIGRDAASGAFGKVAGSLGAIGAVSTGLVVGILALGAAFVTLGVQSVSTAISVESAFAGIMKTTDGLGDSFFDLTEAGEAVLQDFRDLSKEVPLTLEELMKIGELGGQLGVADEALAGFTKVIADLGVTTNLTTESAATDIARLANIYDIASGDLVDNTERVGSVLVDLGNNFATTEADIMAFGLRLASAGRIAGFTQEDLLAIGAALSSVGVEAERGGTAVQKVMISMTESVALGGDKLELFAKTAGMSSDQFISAWGDDPALAFAKFVSGLGDAGDGAFAILDELGLTDQRLIQAFLALSSSGDLLTETLTTANSAWEENTALADEAEKRYATTESTWQMIKNQFRDIGLSIGMVFLPAVQNLLEIAAPILEGFGATVTEKLGLVEDFFSRSTEWKFAKINELLPPEWQEAFREFLGLSFDIKEFWEGQSPSIQKNVSDVFTALSETSGVASEELGKFTEGALKSLRAWFDENIPEITGVLYVFSYYFTGTFLKNLQDNIQVIRPLLNGFVDEFLLNLQLLIDVFTGNWSDAWETFKDILESGWNAIVESFSILSEQLLGDMGLTKDEFSDIFSGWVDDVVGWANEIASAVGEAFGSLHGSGMSGLLGNLGISITPHIGAATGFAGVIPSGYPDDSFLIGVSSGETVAVAPANTPVTSMTGSGGGGYSVPFVYAPVFSLDRRDDIITALRPIIEEINRDINGGT